MVIEQWSDDLAWASSGSWSLKDYCHRVSLCTNLRGTELKRASRALMKREISEMEITCPEESGALIHILESSGAKVFLKEDVLTSHSSRPAKAGG